MENSKGHATSPSSVENPWMKFMLDRSVIFSILLSMIIQIILVFGGTFRYRSGSRWLNFTIWASYMGADFVATSALGTMIHYSSGAMIYAIWACLVMVHLGGPDTITAYSLPDSNLWKRHCFTIVYQGSVAAYVVYVSAVQGGAEIEWNLLVAAFLIFLVGMSKYAERVRALWLAGPSQIVSSAQPIYNFMKTEHALGLHIDDEDDPIPDDEIADVDQYRDQREEKVDQKTVDYQYIVAGEERINEDDDNADWSESIVTIKDVWEHEGEDVTDSYLLCVSHALFKMYKRRFAVLRFHEGTLMKTRSFFVKWRFSEIQVFNILEMEMKFMYDYLFSKSSGTAFSGWGFGMRVVNICVLGLCWFLILRGLRETEDVVREQRIVTYILMCVAIGLEGFQLGRIMVSDWSMVWLICANIRQSRKLSERWWCSCTAKLIQRVATVVGRVRKAVGGKYWQNQIPQLCVLETCFSARTHSYPLLRKVLAFLPLEKFIMRGYINVVTALHIKREFLHDDEKCRLVRYFDADFFKLREVLSTLKEDLEDWEKGVGWEHVILAWHVATTIKERLQDQSEIQDERVKRDIEFSVRMSRYVAYLLVTCPELLPVDAENAKRVYREVFSEIMGENGTLDEFCKNFKDSAITTYGSVPLRMAKAQVTKILKASVEKRWADLAAAWMDMLGMCGAYDKSGEHGERVTVGGELLTFIWVLMEHRGLGEEWYNPMAMKRDPRLS